MDRLSALDTSFLTNESSSAHMHVGGDPGLRGASAGVRGPPRARLRPACTWSPASARSWPIRRWRPGVRSGSTTRRSTSSTTSATRRSPPGLRGAAAEHRVEDLLPAARPDEAALGALADPGPDAQAVRARVEDAPRPGRRHLRRRHRDGAVRRQARPGADPARPRVGPGAAAVVGAPGRQGRRGPGPAARAARPPAGACDRTTSQRPRAGGGDGRGGRRGRVDVRRPGARAYP